MAVDGSLNFDTKVNTDGFEKDTEKINSETKKTADKVTSEAEKVKKKIDSILKDTERSNKSKAASISAIYRKQGLNQKEAFEKAWSHIERNSAETNDDIVKHSKSANKKIKRHFSDTGKSVSSSMKVTGGEISNGLGNLKSMLGKVAVAMAAAFSVKKIIDFGKQSVETASDLQEVQNVVDTAFGSMSDKMEKFADNSIKQFGISRLAAKQTGSTFMAMASGMGLAQDTASDMAIALTGLSADMASFYNVEQDVASTALKSVFTGETETLKQFGIVMTEANLEAFALSQGINKSLSAMTQAEKVQLRYNYVMSQTALAQGDFAKTSDSWANQTRILSEQWKEFSGTVGTLLMNVLLPAVKTLNNALSSLISWAKSATQAIADLFGIKMQDSSPAGILNEDTASISDNASSTADSYSDMADSAKKAQKATENQLAGFDKITKLSDNKSDDDNNSSKAPAKINTAGYGAGNIKTKVEVDTNGANKKLKDFWKNIKSTFKKVGQYIKDVFGADFSSIVDNFRSIFSSIADIAKGTFGGIKGMFKSCIGLVGTYVTGLVSVFLKIFNTISTGIKKFLDNNKQKIIDGINAITGNLSSAFNNLKQYYQTIFGTFGASVDRMRETVSNAIANLLGGITNLALSIGTIVSDAFRIYTENLALWAEENSAKIGSVFDSFQQLGADLINLFGDIFNDISESLTSWWEEQMAPVWDKICQAVLGVADTLMNIWLEWIYPIIQKVIAWAHKMWDEHLRGVFDSILSFVSKIGDFIATLWNNILKPVVDWLITFLKPKIMWVVNTILDVVDTLVGWISNLVKGIMRSLGGLLDFLTGVFSLDFKKAWNGIKDFFGGIWDAMWGSVKTVVNLIIDGINFLWSGLYSTIASIVNGIGGIVESVGDFLGFDIGFSIPDEPPKIPHLATGTVVPANYGEFLAVLGDNKRETEVVSPLSTIEQAVGNAMKKYGGIGGGDIVIHATFDVDGRKLHKEVVRINKQEIRKTGNNPLVPVRA